MPKRPDLHAPIVRKGEIMSILMGKTTAKQAGTSRKGSPYTTRPVHLLQRDILIGVPLLLIRAVDKFGCVSWN